MNEDYLNIFEKTEELVSKNTNLIEILYGYCMGREEDCSMGALLELVETIKETQEQLVTEIDRSETMLNHFLFKHGLLE